MTRADGVRDRSAFFSLAYHPRVVAQEHVLVEGHLCLCPHDALGHVYDAFSMVNSGECVVLNIPLEIIRSRVAVLLIWAKRTNIAGRVVDEAVATHFVFALETLSAYTSRAVLHGTVIWSRV